MYYMRYVREMLQEKVQAKSARNDVVFRSTVMDWMDLLWEWQAMRRMHLR